jgi:aquaporin Z
MKAYLAESVGTFFLVLGGVGSAVIAGDKIGIIGVAFAFGLSLLAMAYALGPISGCHINPAVTFGMYLSRRIGGREALVYGVAQTIGAIVASALIFFIVSRRADGYDLGVLGLGANGYGLHSPGGYSAVAAFVAEAVFTLLLVLTVLGATARNSAPGFAGIPIGFVLVLIHLVSIPITNTSVNPARSIGTALMVRGWALEQLWLFIVAPMVGALGAAVLARMIVASDVKLDLQDRQARAA